MGVGRRAPHRVRAAYAQALKEIPLPVRSLTGIDPDGLAIIAEAEIAQRRVQFGLLWGLPRLWIALPDHLPAVLGFLTGIDTDRPELHVTEPDHLEWACTKNRAAQIKREGLAAWRAAQKECEG